MTRKILIPLFVTCAAAVAIVAGPSAAASLDREEGTPPVSVCGQSDPSVAEAAAVAGVDAEDIVWVME